MSTQKQLETLLAQPASVENFQRLHALHQQALQTGTPEEKYTCCLAICHRYRLHRPDPHWWSLPEVEKKTCFLEGHYWPVLGKLEAGFLLLKMERSLQVSKAVCRQNDTDKTTN